ncbi:MAG: hypothetical protein BIFFINMI_02340 [Phycisphaerae bacterium]|nr:hypothetical protein [Phycisphaerae bacterium]
MAHANLQFAWCWMLTGLLTGALLGLGFHREQWMGGYGGWRRRLMRLGHIAFLGTGLLNLGFALTAIQLHMSGRWLAAASVLLIAGAVAMPVNCFLAAWREPFRHLFFIPVIGLVGGVAAFVVPLLARF